MDERIAVIGLGYVGLPVALAFAKKFPGTIGFDISSARVAALKSGKDHTAEVTASVLSEVDLHLTDDPADLAGITFFVVAVPTPIDTNKQPDLTALLSASTLVGRALSRGAIVVFESTVYPGVTEELCGPKLAEVSGLRQGVDFKLGYSPERINPGDKLHTLEKIVKVVSAEDSGSLQRVAEVYGAIIEAGVHQAPSIKVAEAAKVIENTQRDLNIALMNELAIIFNRLGIRTKDVLEAAATKWNFLGFYPGLVGGHCIGVDPYYLTAKAEAVGYHPEVILAGRRINDGMGAFVAQETLKMLATHGQSVVGARVGILGLTFKEDVPDLRNSRVPDIVAELKSFGIGPLIHDPLANPAVAQTEYGISLLPWAELDRLDALILAVSHASYLNQPLERLLAGLKPNGVLVDVKSAIDPATLPQDVVYWSL